MRIDFNFRLFPKECVGLDSYNHIKGGNIFPLYSLHPPLALPQAFPPHCFLLHPPPQSSTFPPSAFIQSSNRILHITITFVNSPYRYTTYLIDRDGSTTSTVVNRTQSSRSSSRTEPEPELNASVQFAFNRSAEPSNSFEPNLNVEHFYTQTPCCVGQS